MSDNAESLYTFLELALSQPDLASLVSEIERFGKLRFQAGTVKLQLSSESEQEEELANCLPLFSLDGIMVAHLHSERPIPNSFDRFLKVAAWSIRRLQLFEVERNQADVVRSLRLAQKIVEEGLPTEPAFALGWEVYGRLQPSAQIGGDLFATLVS